jgi:lipopolysaccharide/colanic/teichoic acid biosynthesis glycosyltransferase
VVELQKMMELFSRIVAFVMIVILSPLFLLISIMSLLFQGSPILFKQDRVGYGYSIFKLRKFRSMQENSGESKITDANDSRVTQWGQFLRSAKLDELPQLWNILVGEMRFIGPRPEVEEFVKEDEFSFLKDIKPGLTDFSSILFRDEATILAKKGGVEKYPELLKIKLSLGHLYAEHKGFWLDFKLVILTLVSILSPGLAIRWVKKYFIEEYDPDLIEVIDEWII